MTCSDLTQEFKQLVTSKENQSPNSSKRQRQTTNPSSPHSNDAWTKQATQVATNLTTFAQFLSSIRRPYLDLSSSSVSSSTTNSTARGGLDQTKQGFAQWEGVKSLSDRERDEIDFSVKIALKKSVDRVRELEQLEKVRISNEKKKHSTSSTSSSSGLSRFFSPSSSLPSPAVSSSDSLSSHRAFITLYLNTLLQRVSERQRIQQETRVTRQLEKTSSLGGFGGGRALGMDRLGKEMASTAQQRYDDTKRGSKGKGKSEEEWESMDSNGGGGERGHTGGVPSIYKPIQGSFEIDEEEEEEDELNQLGTELTQEQIQRFEAEESELLQATRTDLESLKTAESSLLEISSLQTQLAVHLSQQSELTDKLWEEVQEVNGRVGEGNLQLKKAKERGRDSRVWLLVFLFGSSFTLLFLDYYSS
ncbi:hypothetical protein JCM5353_006845 [Sporobolomyces roseus]